MISAEIHKNKNAFFLLLTAFLFSLLRLPSLIEPYWYGDEGIYQVIGIALNQGRILYKDIWDNKPPVLYILYALVNGDQFGARFLSLIFGVASVVVFFILAKKIFTSTRAVYISTFFYTLFFGLPLLEGNIANAENFMHAPILLAFYLVLSRRNRFLHSFLAGMLLSFAFLTKIVAIFDFAALILILFTVKYMNISILTTSKSYLRKLAEIMGEESILILSFVLPIGATIIYFFLHGALIDYYKAVFSQNVGYVGYGNYFLIPQGLLIIKLFFLGVFVWLIFYFRKNLKVAGVLIYIWLAFSLFNALFSARPYTHYLLVLLPSFSLFVGYFFQEKKMLKLQVVLILLILIIISKNFRIYEKIIPYYRNYVEFIFLNKTVNRYQEFFDRNTPRDYAIANFLGMRARNSVFLWSDSGQIYALAKKLPPGRYIVAYHILFYKDGILETKHALEKFGPKYIVDTKYDKEINNFITSYIPSYRIGNSQIYERKF